MKDSNENVKKRRLVFSFVVVVDDDDDDDDDCLDLDLAELLVDDAGDGGGEGLAPLPEDAGVTVVGRIDFGMVNTAVFAGPVQYCHVVVVRVFC